MVSLSPGVCTASNTNNPVSNLTASVCSRCAFFSVWQGRTCSKECRIVTRRHRTSRPKSDAVLSPVITPSLDWPANTTCHAPLRGGGGGGAGGAIMELLGVVAGARFHGRDSFAVKSSLLGILLGKGSILWFIKVTKLLLRPSVGFVAPMTLAMLFAKAVFLLA